MPIYVTENRCMQQILNVLLEEVALSLEAALKLREGAGSAPSRPLA